MDFGFKLPNSGPFADPATLRLFATQAEELGYSSVWVHDHVHRSVEDAQHHFAMGSSEAWKHPVVPNVFEALSTLAWVAGYTTRVRLGTSAALMSVRNPTWLAKTAATIDSLSGGRLILGLVTGGPYLERELAAVGHLERVGKRGKVAEEWLDILKGLWTKDTFSYTGELITIADAIVYPKPAQTHLPILLGGFSDATLNRVARKADGWLPVMASVEAVATARQKLDTYAQALGRQPSSISIFSEHWLAVDKSDEAAIKRAEATTRGLADYVTSHPRSSEDQMNRLKGRELEHTLAGSPEHLVERIKEYEKAGVDHLICRSVGTSVDEVLEIMQQFSEEVMPRL